MVKERNIAVCIILSIVTCGIYGIYWLIVTNDESKVAANEPSAPSGGIVFLLTLITCNIYGIYWAYQMGKRMQVAMQNSGINSEDRSVIYLILSLFGFQIINMCLIQNDLNTVVRAHTNGGNNGYYNNNNYNNNDYNNGYYNSNNNGFNNNNDNNNNNNNNNNNG